jgi:hypothetical protein
MDVSFHLHRGDETRAYVTSVYGSDWLTITDKDGSAFTLFIPRELVADAQAFAESVTTYGAKRGIMSA